MDKAIQDQLYDPKKKQKSAWLDFVMKHKHLRTPKGLIDLKAISRLWKSRDKGNGRGRMGAYMRKATLRRVAKLHKSYDPHRLIETKEEGGREIPAATDHYHKNIKVYDPKKHGISRPPKRWFYAMLQGIEKRSDVRNPAAIVASIWRRLSPSKRLQIKQREVAGKPFKYDLPLPDDRATHGTGTLRMVKPFKLTEVQVNISPKDYIAALKSGLFQKMKRGDGSIALVSRCKSQKANCNIFVDKTGAK